MKINKNLVDVIGVPIDLGASRRGVDMGPSAIRYAGLKKAIENMGITYFDKGNITVPVPEYIDMQSNKNLRHIKEITLVNEKLFKKTKESLLEGHFPLVLGGDHSIALGTILGVQSVFENIGVIWLDAHGDFNNDTTSPSGNLHGMSLAACTGYGAPRMTNFKPDNVKFVDPRKVVLIGVRSLDKSEIILLKESGVNVFTIADIDKYGIKKVMKKALEIVTCDTNGFHVSFDLDVINPNEAPGVGTPVSGGLTYREAHFIVETIADNENVLSADFVELNPILDKSNITGELAVTLIESLLGKKIY
jgi:arginase